MPTSYDDETILGIKRTIKELGLNQSHHYNMIQNHSRVMDDFRTQMLAVTNDVSSIKESLKEAPQMLNIGKELDSLKSSLATYGATMSDLKLGLSELKDSQVSSSSLSESLIAINSTLQARLNFVVEDLHHHHVHDVIFPVFFSDRTHCCNSSFLFVTLGYHNRTTKYNGTSRCSEPVQPFSEGRCCPIGSNQTGSPTKE